ncbi:MAG: DUF445 domain-containing protein [Bacteroidetes bacterium]|nr:DUF445 domain-containing protein [Bacteroidota bacterium]
MKQSRVLAPVSLIAALVLFAATLPFRDIFAGGLLHAFAEAAMIGGLADWFAVVALFHHPLGLPIPHTGILPRHRAKLTSGIIDMVQNRWLTKDTILERIVGWNVSALLLSTLDNAENRERLLRLLRGALGALLRDIDEKHFSERLTQLLARNVHTDDILRWTGAVGSRGVEQGLHGTLFAYGIGKGGEWLNTPEIRKVIVRHLHDIAEQYASNPVRRIGKWMAESVNALNYDDLAEAIVRTLGEELVRMRDDEAHPAREDFDRWMRGTIEGLQTNQEVRTVVEQWRTDMLDNGRASELLRQPVERLRAWLIGDLEKEDSVIMQQLRAAMEKALQGFATNEESQRQLDHWVKEKIATIVEQHHGEIGDMVKHNLEKLDDEELVRQIEEKVGDDLQFIRLNGAIVGGLVGTGIFLLKYFVFP